ncbi:MAG: AraC family transcriptional regulator [Clostridia bacterium]|nr:AraC family transcriptional regulator [Clostridia bacterium]
MDISLINPYIRVAIPSVLGANSEIKTRVIYDYELIFIEQGEFTFVYDGKANDCKTGDVILIEPGVPHSFHMSNEPLRQPHIHFDITYRENSEQIPISFKDKSAMTKTEVTWIHENYFSASSRSPLLNVSDKSTFQKLFYQIITLTGNGEKLLAKGYLTQLLAFLIKENFPTFFQEKKSLSVAKQMKDFIDSKQGLTMKLDDFENMFFYDKFYLEKMFRTEYGVGLIKYRNEQRLNYAKKLLKTSSVSFVTEELGFQSIYAFSRAYKNRFGYPPSEEKHL